MHWTSLGPALLHVRDGLSLGQDRRDARARVGEDGANLTDLALVDSSPHERVAQDRDEAADLGTQAADGVAAAALPWGAKAAPAATSMVVVVPVSMVAVMSGSVLVVRAAVGMRHRPTAPTPRTASAAPWLPRVLGVGLRVGVAQRRSYEERAREEGQEASAPEFSRRSIPGATVATVAMMATGEGRPAGVERWVKVVCMMCVHLVLLLIC